MLHILPRPETSPSSAWACRLLPGRISYSPEVVKQQNGATLGYWNHTCEDSIDKNGC